MLRIYLFDFWFQVFEKYRQKFGIENSLLYLSLSYLVSVLFILGGVHKFVGTTYSFFFYLKLPRFVNTSPFFFKYIKKLMRKSVGSFSIYLSKFYLIRKANRRVLIGGFVFQTNADSWCLFLVLIKWYLFSRKLNGFWRALLPRLLGRHANLYLAWLNFRSLLCGKSATPQKPVL